MEDKQPESTFYLDAKQVLQELGIDAPGVSGYLAKPAKKPRNDRKVCYIRGFAWELHPTKGWKKVRLTPAERKLFEHRGIIT